MTQEGSRESSSPRSHMGAGQAVEGGHPTVGGVMFSRLFSQVSRKRAALIQNKPAVTAMGFFPCFFVVCLS